MESAPLLHKVYIAASSLTRFQCEPRLFRAQSFAPPVRSRVQNWSFHKVCTAIHKRLMQVDANRAAEPWLAEPD